MRGLKFFLLALTALLVLVWMTSHNPAAARSLSVRIGERPALEVHISQDDIENHLFSFSDLLGIGEDIFAARWTKLDGQGRPAATGDGTPTHRDPAHDPGFLRTSGPDSSSCADCHNQPAIGGAGGFVSNVFVMAQTLDPVIESVSAEFSNERNTLGMNGSGAIEMLAREMTGQLLAIRESALRDARNTGKQVTRSLDTKGVNFGKIVAQPDGGLDTSLVEGVDEDLVIKPFHQKGVVNSVRVFTVNAFNHHHGIQAVERFGVGQLDNRGNAIVTDDFDGDGVADELSRGDVTAAILFQVGMNIPGRVIPDDAERRLAAKQGEVLFATIGCTDCHKAVLVLDSPFFSEPNPYNPPGNLRPQDVTRPYAFDLTQDIPSPRLQPSAFGGAFVYAYTDLKRHVICDEDDPFFRNERVVQGGVPVDEFITRKLWDVGNTGPYGHRGDLTTITEAILHHAGEARPQRERFEALGVEEQAEIVEFLKQLQVLPDGAPPVVSESRLHAMRDGQTRVSVWTLLNRVFQ